MQSDAVRQERISRLLVAARKLVQSGDPLGAVPLLASSTGLSLQGVRWALETCLEVDPGEDELAALLRAAPQSSAAHVLLSSNVFVAAHRALALALASAPRVFVRPSRREPEMVALLREAAGPELFTVVERLTPVAGDVVYAYGSNETLEALRWPSGVRVLAHGNGIGAAVCRFSEADDAELDQVAERLAADIALFDQRGCLSPRLCVVEAAAPLVERFATAVRDALERFERRVPRGRMHPAELAEARRYAETWTYAGAYLESKAGGVSVDLATMKPAPCPIGRHMHFVRAENACETLAPLRALLTTIGVHGERSLQSRLAHAFPEARITALGSMQRPPLDGPVDRRGQVAAQPGAGG